MSDPHPEPGVIGPGSISPGSISLGMIGLGVMGHQLALNLADHGAQVVAFDLGEAGRTRMRAAGHERVAVVEGLPNLIESLAPPRALLLMVPAGEPVDAVIAALQPLLEPGDILIDGGNSHFPDTIRRTAYVESKGLLFVGSGVSGGEEGALKGPSMMPGGSPAAWPHLQPIFQSICAFTPEGEPCCEWIGENGAGHFVKMVHNGIEYGDMQLICEVYDLMKRGAGLTNAEMHQVFADWNRGELDSYLIEITRDILAVKDEATGGEVLDAILDTAGQKGTGKWTVVSALEGGAPLTTVVEAVMARALSAQKPLRERAAELPGPLAPPIGDRAAHLRDLEAALYAAKIIGYTQGFLLLQQESARHAWGTDKAAVARTWRGGCIIRSRFLGDIARAFDADPNLDLLLLAPFFREAIAAAQAGWRRTVAFGAAHGVALPAMGAALAFYDGLRTADGPANLLQAQRDYFGAHTFLRRDDPTGPPLHVDWAALRR
jgi:6-phosphogluconate dehydrogenase